MTLSKEIIEDKIEVVGEHKDVQVRSATVIKEDGVEINRSFERKRLVCSVKDNDGNWVDTDISGESSQVQGICNSVWTSDVKTAYQNYVDANTPVDQSVDVEE